MYQPIGLVSVDASTDTSPCASKLACPLGWFTSAWQANEPACRDGVHQHAPPKGLYRLQPPAARSVAATDVTSVYQTDVTSAAPTDTLCLCSNVSVGPADIKPVWATDVTSVASGRRYRRGL
ncbi:hypothetical protein PCANC_18684 [Puccinia coronata f. sp. avenae]|uniref:Uncharacterized protein n=1 Tax=Puccinia coronata f. sp. avenae TaxID=200324 RepID=A0A2N5VCA4_9BASI|nr:hypothetical protein PCANC_18684 [Puccinia coronata f. sp. avenae]